MVDDGFRIHDVTAHRVAVLAQVSILALQILQLPLKTLLLTCLLLDLLLVVLTQVADAVLKGCLAGLHICNPHFEGFKHGVKVGAILKLASVGVDDGVVDVLSASDLSGGSRRGDSLAVFDHSGRTRGRMPKSLLAMAVFLVTGRNLGSVSVG